MSGDIGLQAVKCPEYFCYPGDKAALSETAERATPLFILAVFTNAVYTPMSTPLFAFAVTRSISYFFEKMSDTTNPGLLDNAKKIIQSQYDKYPKAKAITLLFMLIISCVLPELGMIIGAVAGAIDGIVARQNLIKEQDRIAAIG